MSWYAWKHWRIAYSRNRGGEMIDGWGKWRHVAIGFWWLL